MLQRLCNVPPVSAALEPAVASVDGDVLVWRFDRPTEAISSASVNGGAGRIDWILNVGVERGYARTDLDEHAAGIASKLGLDGRGTALFTAVDVRGVCRAECDGVVVHATVGISGPTWAAGRELVPESSEAGTINVVVQLPVGLDPGAAVNATMTATEAKVQALAEHGIDGTGTATDAVVVAWPATGHQERFAGPRSVWGRKLAIAVHSAVQAGLPQNP